MPKTPKVQYRKENLQNAIKAVQDADNKLSTRQIAENYGVPRTSLRYYIENPGHKTSLGPSPVLTVSEESQLEEWIIISARKGFPRNKEDILDTVQKFLVENPRPNLFTNNRPGDGWWKAFLKRHPRLTIRTSEGVSKASSYVSEKDIRGWFAEISDYAKEKDLTPILNDPNRIFNADETNFQICVKTGQVLAEKGAKNVYNIEQSQAKESITVLFTFSAAGQVCCPFVIYPYQRMPIKKISDSVPDGWGIGKSDSGWMTTETFYEFIANVFHPYLVSNNVKLPVILFVDGHKTHLNFHLSQLCTHLQIELIALYPNATRILQPADVAAFRPLKMGWKKTVRKWQNENNNQGVTKLNFATVLNETVITSLRPEILVNGFKACGLYPFNPDAIDYNKCLGDKNENVTSQKNKMIPDSAMLSYAKFKEIIGTTLSNDFENRSQNLPCQKSNEHLNKLFQIWQAYHDVEVMSTTKEGIDSSVVTSQKGDKAVQVVDFPNVSPQRNEEECVAEINDFSELALKTRDFKEIEGALSLDITSTVPEKSKFESTPSVVTVKSTLELSSPQRNEQGCVEEDSELVFQIPDT
ncbi:uncharacterized protein LOC134671563 [Cydia fagiglandana]|uniref:uncharacterized protein LOC134671563 n=1 Tax=Cydia fagiglandana TaxID=1458189 RepID=UPI002FEE2869